ncbi:hypothetical protein CDO73_00800 [Saccharibacillus sp. O23]|uniref:hypothetical protein n=1 Tax=Saccharibacillus sp. O23 TaxID=2009338 RepID=UPI000B4E7EBD|nr:hypothetical protein [Saccharibacillus sp. O23]OWR33079.1 hypothetical protein CDO73_00800 [Saccharibacillus sp. O23]
MLRTTEKETERKLRNLKKEKPNYDAMWSRIRLEADKRESGWQEQVVPPKKASPKKRWIMPAACASLAAVIALGAAASQGYFESIRSETKAAPLGQSVGVQKEVEGLILKLNSAVQGTDRNNRPSEGIERMILDFSLSGFGSEDVRMAAFDQASITDLDTGKKLSINMGDFNTNYSGSIEDWAASRKLNTSAEITGDLSKTEGKHRYRLELSDLYMIKRSNVPIAGKVKLGEEYTVLPDRDFKMKITDIRWDQKQGLMKIKFLPNQNVPRLDTQNPATLGMDRGNYVSLKLGDKDLGYSGWSEPLNLKAGEDEVEGEYDVRGLTEDQVKDMTMTFNYAETVRKVKGPWTIDFTLDSSKVQIPTETVPIADDSELTEQTGWTLGDAQLDAYGVKIPLNRNAADAEPGDRFKDGQVLNYTRISLTDGKVTAVGIQEPMPGVEPREQNQKGQEYFQFGTQGMEANQKGDSKTYDAWSSYDFRGKPLTATFGEAWIAHVDPEHWVSLGVPTAEERTVTDTLVNGKNVEYTVHRKGADIAVEIEVPKDVLVLEGTRLRVDGRDYAFDPTKTDASAVRNEQGYYNRVDIYRNVPEGKAFELNLIAYSTVDATKKATVVVRK